MTRTLTFQGSILRPELGTTFENLNFRLLNSPDEIVWITVANVTDANRARHLELREKLFNIMLQSPYVKVVEFSFPEVLISLQDFYKFNVWRGGDAIHGFDNSQMELLIYTSRNREEQGKFTASLGRDYNQFINSFCCFRYKVGIRILPTFCCNLKTNVQINVMNYTCNSQGHGAWI